MILNLEKSYEEIAEIYGGFRLKEDFLEAGNAALAKFGVQAELNDDDVIRIHFVDRLLYTQDELDEICDCDEAEENLKSWRVRIDACIELSDDPSIGIREAYCRHQVVTPWEDDFNDCYELTDVESEQGIILIEAFLDAVVDCA